MSYANPAYADVSEKPAAKEFTIDKKSCYEGTSEGNKDTSTKKLLLMLFLVVLVLMLGTICACVAFAVEISNLKSTPINMEISSTVDAQNDFAASIQQLKCFP